MSNPKKQKKMELNIDNGAAREVICKRVENGNYFPNGDLVKKGKKYHLVKMDVHPWYTDVYLKEFPDKVFNSVQFAECFKTEAEVKELVKANGRERRIVATFSENNMPQIVLSNNLTIDLSRHKEEITSLALGDALTIGRNVDCDIQLPNDGIYSRMHCYIAKTLKGKYGLVDCSLNGTYVSL